MSSLRRLPLASAGALLLILAASPSRRLAAQTNLEGSKWSIEQEGVNDPVLWWLGSEGRVRTGDLGMVIVGAKWRMAGDSFFVAIGDTLKYAAVLMSNRLVGGVRTGPHRQEGWWSGTRADQPAAVAANPPAQTPAQTMSRPTDPGAATTAPAPTTTPASTPPAGTRTIHHITREGETPAVSSPPAAAPAPAPAPTTGNPPASGRTIRRIERAQNSPAVQAANGAAAASPGSTAEFTGRWVADQTGGMIAWMQFKADGTFDFAMASGSQYSGDLAELDGRRVARFIVTGAGTIPFYVSRDGEALVLTGVGPAGAQFRYHRGEGSGSGAAGGTASGVAPAMGVDAAQYYGHWVHTNPNTGIAIDFRADSTFTLVRRNAADQSGKWSVEGTGLKFSANLLGDDTRDVLASFDGPTLNLQPRGSLLKLTLNRGGTREPAVRQ